MPTVSGRNTMVPIFAQIPFDATDTVIEVIILVGISIKVIMSINSNLDGLLFT